MVALIIILAILIIAFAVYKTFFLTIIVGRSMFPTFYPNDIILTRRVRHRVFPDKPKKGEIYFFDKPGDTDRLIVKRLQSYRYRRKNTPCWFLGDNRDESCDSRMFGYVDWKSVKYKYVKTLVKSKRI